jgi:serine/threonine protein kinase/Ca2+-binding EF-hand superfamily protein
MGNKNSSFGRLHAEAKLAASKFDEDELHILKQTWQDLADRCEGRGIDKDTFLQYFPLNGLLGERLFLSFDTKHNGHIDFDEFVMALATLARGSIDARIHFIFNMCDVSSDQTVSKAELETLLNQVPKDIMHGERDPLEARTQEEASGGGGRSPTSTGSPLVSSSASSESDSGGSGKHDSDTEYEDEVDAYTNHDVVEKCFQDCDINHAGKLNYEQFKMWVLKTPVVLGYIESILPYTGIKQTTCHVDKAETLPLMQRRLSMRRASGSSLSIINPSDLDPVVSPKGTSQSSKNLVRMDSLDSNSGRTRTKTSNSPPPESSVVRSRSPTAQSVGTSESQQVIQLSNTKYNDKHGKKNAHDVLPNVSGAAKAIESVDAEMESTADDSESPETIKHLTAAMNLARSHPLRSAIKELIDHIENGDPINSVISPVPRKSTSENMEEVYNEVVKLEGHLWKIGTTLSMWSKRYYVLSGNCMYYYSKENDVRPKGVVFLSGSSIENISDESNELKGYFGFECVHMTLTAAESDHHRHERRIFYCQSEQERDHWVRTLQLSAHVLPINEEYVIGKELGRGRFSVVHECVHKATGVHAAVKIINKSTVKPDEKALLRTEIAVLKLMDHPHIIKMLNLYESRDTIYIVMEMLKGGELFERIVGRPRFTEVEAAKLLRPLLESVAYMHDLGIVHRDIKPENILCGENLSELKIADFGLSKMILPKEKMTQPCGTLSYVAPEVLTNQGYGKEADLWSIGVIMFLLICGKLPFDGASADEIIQATVQGDLKVNPHVWGKLSEPAKHLLRSLLNKSATERLTAREALKHPFIQLNAPREKHHHHHHHHKSKPTCEHTSASDAGSSRPTSPGSPPQEEKSGKESTSGVTPAPAISSGAARAN